MVHGDRSRVFHTCFSRVAMFLKALMTLTIANTSTSRCHRFAKHMLIIVVKAYSWRVSICTMITDMMCLCVCRLKSMTFKSVKHCK